MASENLPTDNDGWFKRHIIESLGELKTGHLEVIRNQREMHESNIARMEEMSRTIQEHEESDQRQFNAVQQSISDLQPAKKIVYGAITLLLVAFMGAVIALVITKH